MYEQKFMKIAFYLFLTTVMIISVKEMWKDMCGLWAYKNAPREWVNVEIVNKISDTNIILLIESTNYIAVIKPNKVEVLSVAIDAATYAAIEKGDLIRMAFEKFENGGTAPFSWRYKLSDIEIIPQE